MDDLINRAAAIDAVKELCEHYTPTKSVKHPHMDFVIEELQQLPSAQPEQECEKCVFRPFKQFQPEPQWIPCSERLPKPQAETQRRHWFLTTNACGNVSMTKYEFCGDYGFIGWGTHRPVDIQIIAWMPLPEPYKGES